MADLYISKNTGYFMGLKLRSKPLSRIIFFSSIFYWQDSHDSGFSREQAIAAEGVTVGVVATGLVVASTVALLILVAGRETSDPCNRFCNAPLSFAQASMTSGWRFRGTFGHTVLSTKSNTLPSEGVLCSGIAVPPNLDCCCSKLALGVWASRICRTKKYII
jgi:hypothetical protein